MTEQENFIEKMYSEEFMKELQSELGGFEISFRKLGKDGNVFQQKIEWFTKTNQL